MTEDDFWQLIETLDTYALRSGDEDGALKPLSEALSRLVPVDIEQFQEYLAQSLYQLDGEEYADNAGESGESGDGFLYCRCFVVGCGRDMFEAAVADPTRMPKSLDHWFEAILYCAGEVLANVTGEDRHIETSVSYETGANSDRWPDRPVIELTPAQIAEKYEVDYQRALSSVVHASRRGNYRYVIELLSPYTERLSQKFRRMLDDARLQIESEAQPEE